MRRLRYDWIWIAASVLALDRASKYVVETLTPLGYMLPVVPGFFTFVHAANPGVAFGLFADAPSGVVTIILSAATVVVCALLIGLLTSGRAGHRLSTLGVSLILGGALGNLFDRIFHAGVTDFLYFHIGSHYWPAFNVADAAIAVGTTLVGIELIFLSGRHDHAEAHPVGGAASEENAARGGDQA
jgi:signal peptidase II